MAPRVSLLLSVRNGMPFVRETLDAWLAQTVPEFELLVWDNNSTDGTLNCISEFRDPRVRVVFSGRDCGLQNGWFGLLREARGEFCLSPDADDLPHPTLLECLLRRLSKSGDALLAHASFSLIDFQGSPANPALQPAPDLPAQISSKDMLPILLQHNPIKKSSALMRTHAAKTAATRAAHRMLSAVDWYFWFLLFSEEGEALYERKPLLQYRLHGNSLSNAEGWSGRRDVEDLLAPWCGLLDAASHSPCARRIYRQMAHLLAPVLLMRALRVALRSRYLHPGFLPCAPRIIKNCFRSPLQALRMQKRLRRKIEFPCAGFLAPNECLRSSIFHVADTPAPPPPLRICMLTVDGRELRGGGLKPVYGSAVAALLEGFHDMDCEASGVGIDVVSFGPGGNVVCENEGCGVRHWSLPTPRFAKARHAYVGRIWALRAWLRQNPVTLVHAQGTERWCGWVAAWCGRPFVLTIHGHVQGLRRHLRLRPRAYWLLHEIFERWAVCRAEAVNSLSQAVGDELEGKARRLVIIPNAASKVFFANEPRPESPPLALQIGDILPGKRPLELLRALDKFPPTFRMIFLGYTPPDSSYAAEFKKEIDSRPWAEIISPGPQELVAAWLSKASLLVHPSLAENCPMVILEAMAAGVPVVASDAGGIPELFPSASEGRILEANDLDGMARTLRALAQDADTRREIGRRARLRADQFHHPCTVAQRTRTTYENLISNLNFEG